jgi:hypothetical protein
MKQIAHKWVITFYLLAKKLHIYMFEAGFKKDGLAGDSDGGGVVNTFHIVIRQTRFLQIVLGRRATIPAIGKALHMMFMRSSLVRGLSYPPPGAETGGGKYRRG